MRVYARCMASICYCAALRSAARKVTAVYDDSLASTGVNLAQFSLQTPCIFDLRNRKVVAPFTQNRLDRALGLEQHLTPQRSNGVRAMVDRIRADAAGLRLAAL